MLKEAWLEKPPDNLLSGVAVNPQEPAFSFGVSGLPDGKYQLQDWESLNHSGFNVWREIARAAFNYYHYLGQGKTEQQAGAQALSETRGNIIGFMWEYIRQRKVLANPIELGVYQGSRRVTDKFGNPVLDMIDTKERLGSCREATAKAEQFIIDTAEEAETTGINPEAMVVMVSPSGDSGIEFGGQPLVFLNGQVYIWRMDETGHLEAYTVVAEKEDYHEHRAFLEKLGVNPRDFKGGAGDLERGADIVRNVALIRNDPRYRSFEDVVDAMHVVRRLFARQTGQNLQTVDEEFSSIYQGLARRQELLDLDDNCKAVISKFENLMKDILPALGLLASEMGYGRLDDTNVEQMIDFLKSYRVAQNSARELSKAILQIYACIVGNLPNRRPQERVVFTRQVYDALYNEIRLLTGCVAQSGLSFPGYMINTGLGIRQIVLGGECQKIKCRKCSWEASNEEAQQVQRGELSCCPKCGWKPGES